MIKFSKILKINKPWGGEKILFSKNSSLIKGILKIITIKKGKACSLQYHNKKVENICIISGDAYLYYFDKKTNKQMVSLPKKRDQKIIDKKLFRKKIKKDDNFFIKNKVIHKIEALSDLTFVEISSNHLKDVVRINDEYGRI
jgi:mannose-6-phosphate isomerase